MSRHVCSSFKLQQNEREQRAGKFLSFILSVLNFCLSWNMMDLEMLGNFLETSDLKWRCVSKLPARMLK